MPALTSWRGSSSSGLKVAFALHTARVLNALKGLFSCFSSCLTARLSLSHLPPLLNYMLLLD